MVKHPPLSASRIVEAVGGTVALNRQGDLELSHLGEPLEVGSDGLAFVISESYLKDVERTGAGALVVQASLLEKALALVPACVKTVISAPDAYLGLARLTAVIAASEPLFDWPASPASPKNEIDPTARVAAQAVIGEGVRIGARTVVHAGVVVGPGAQVGADCIFFPGVIVYPRTKIGDRVRVHANCVLGSDGFGYARGPQGSVKIWHLGRVIIEDDVEIGAGTMIDRGTMKDTLIERGAKIDNLCQIGHNGHVKAHAILCAQVGMAGNVTVGKGAILAGKAGVADKVEIGDGALVGPMTGLSKNLAPGEQFMGQIPGRPRREWWRLVAHIDRLPDLFDRVKKLEGKRGHDSKELA